MACPPGNGNERRYLTRSGHEDGLGSGSGMEPSPCGANAGGPGGGPPGGGAGSGSRYG